MKRVIKASGFETNQRVTRSQIESEISTLNEYLYKLKQSGFISEEFEDDDVDYLIKHTRETLNYANSIADCCRSLIKKCEYFRYR